MKYRLLCKKCHTEYNDLYPSQLCECGGMLEVVYKSKMLLPKNPSSFWDFARALPDCRHHLADHDITPLMHLIDSNHSNRSKVWLKDETVWFTKSFKDRGSLIELSKAIEYDYKEIVCASTGNMAISLSNLAKRAGVHVKVFMGNTASIDKIKIIKETHSADISIVNGDFTKASRMAISYAKRKGAFLSGDYCYRKEGQSTIGFEIAAQARQTENIIIPVGNATLFSGIFKAYMRMCSIGMIKRCPRLIAVQATGANPLVRAFRRSSKIRYKEPHTKADGIAVGYPTYGEDALSAIRAVRGSAVSVNEDEMNGAKRALLNKGITSELAGASAFAAYTKTKAKLRDTTVIIVSGANV